MQRQKDKGNQGGDEKEWGKTSPAYPGPQRHPSSLLWADSCSQNGFFFLRVTSVMLESLGFKGTNNKVSDYHTCPVTNLLFLPWPKLGSSFSHWASNSSSSQTDVWAEVAKPLQYGIRWQATSWGLSRLGPSKLGRQPLPTSPVSTGCSQLRRGDWTSAVPPQLSLCNLFLFCCNSSLIGTPLIQNFT